MCSHNINCNYFINLDETISRKWPICRKATSWNLNYKTAPLHSHKNINDLSLLQELKKLWKHNVLQSLKAQNRICLATWNLYQKIHHRNIFKGTKYMWMTKNIISQFTKIAQKFNYSLYIYECKRPESYCIHSLLLFILFYWILNIKHTYV